MGRLGERIGKSFCIFFYRWHLVGGDDSTMHAMAGAPGALRGFGASGLALDVTVEARSDTFKADLALSGDLETLRVKTCELSANWLALSLSEPIEIDLRDGSVAERAVVRAELDLAKQAFFEASGQVEARLRVAPSLAGGPDVAFEGRASGLRFRDYTVDAVSVSGRMEGDRVRIDEMRARPAAVDASFIRVAGEADLAGRSLDFEYALSLSADFLNAQIGAVVLAGALETEGTLGGGFERPSLAGALAPLTFELPELVPVTLEGAYRLEGLDQLDFSGSLRANERLAAELGEDGLAAETLRVDFGETPLVEGHLTAPVRFQLPEDGGDFWDWSGMGALEGALVGSLNPAFCAWLAENTGVAVEAARMDLTVGGTLEKPVGRLDVRVDSLQAPIAGMPPTRCRRFSEPT